MPLSGWTSGASDAAIRPLLGGSGQRRGDGIDDRMLFWIITLLLACIALIAGGLFFRSYMTGTPIGGTLFAPKPEKRLGVSEQASVDGRRRLILIRRDNVEHLIMTGGPVDLVIESGIGAPRTRTEAEAAPAVFNRQPRALNQAAGE